MLLSEEDTNLVRWRLNTFLTTGRISLARIILAYLNNPSSISVSLSNAWYIGLSPSIDRLILSSVIVFTYYGASAPIAFSASTMSFNVYAVPPDAPANTLSLKTKLAEALGVNPVVPPALLC